MLFLFGIYKMNNIIKMRILTLLVFTTVIVIGLFGSVSTAPTIDDVFAEEYKEGNPVISTEVLLSLSV